MGASAPPWGTGNRSRGAPRAAAEPREHGRLARSTPVLRETPWMLDSAKDLAHLPLTHPGGRVPRPPKGHTSRDCSRPPPNREQKSCHAARHAPYPSRPSSFVLFFLVLLPGKSRRPARCLRDYCPVPKWGGAAASAAPTKLFLPPSLPLLTCPPGCHSRGPLVCGGLGT